MSFFPPQDSLMPRVERVALFLAGVVIICGFILSCLLKPDPRGFGTHQQFGLPPCSFQILFGIPCPSCGGTTSFAHFVRGQWWNSFRANAAAFLLAVNCALFVPWAWISSWRGRPFGVRAPALILLWLLLGISAVALMQWGIRLFRFG
jgi:hypothetical protein